ncbi:hypothetical protein ACR820_00020 [Streptomyces netropsis]
MAQTAGIGAWVFGPRAQLDGQQVLSDRVRNRYVAPRPPQLYIISSLLEYARAAAAAIRARVAAVVDVAATVVVMNDGGRFHRRHLLAEAHRHLALALRGRRRDPGLDDRIVAAALTAHCADISEPRTSRGARPEYRLYTAQWALRTCCPWPVVRRLAHRR